MEVGFQFEEIGKVPAPVFEQIFAEVPGGARVANPTFDIPPSTAVGYDTDGSLKPIKAYKLTKPNATADTTMQIAKGSGVQVGDVIAKGKKGVAITAIDSTDADFDVITVTLGVECKTGEVLYQAKAASASAAVPIYTPVYLTGNAVYAGKGDQKVKLVNGANIRKESCNVADEVVALIKSIEKV
ncbi:MAG: hypothetical protein J6P44_02385 [Bacteroidales bacterium]|nr:hypothetical protein [Bacteroidales bacterium]